MRGAAPVPAPRDGMAAERARADPASQGRHRRRRGSPAGRSSRRLGSPARSRARAAGAGGRWPRRPRRSETRWSIRRGCPSKERPPDTELQRAPLLEAQVEIEIAAGDIGRARAAADELDRVAARFQSKALVAGATLARGTGAARGGRRGGRGTVLRRGRAAVERDRGALRGGARAPVLAEALRAGGSEDHAALELQRPARSSTGSRLRRAVRRPRANVFRREGDYWSVVFEGRTVRVRDLKGMRYLAQLLADPGREFHVLDLVAAETGQQTAFGDAGEMLDARAKTPTAAASPRSRTTSSRRAPSRTPSGRRRQTPSATSSSESSRARSASVAATGGPHRPPSALESGVTRAVRQAIARIGEHHPELGEHLEPTHPHRHILRLRSGSRRPRRVDVMTSTTMPPVSGPSPVGGFAVRPGSPSRA